MSEYIEIETELSDDGNTLNVYTNLKLNEGKIEEYHSTQAMEEGSPVAQTLSIIEGINFLQIHGGEIAIRRDPDAARHVIISDISAALKDFFL